jgi:hypothetical protein
MALNRVEVYTPDDKPFGLTYGQWTAKWWKWVLSVPSTNNPLLDDSGSLAEVNQNGPVWFLAGTLGENKCPERSCQLPTGKSVLFPVINYEANVVENPELSSNQQLIEHVMEDMNDIVVKEATVDGEKVSVYRIHSNPFIFDMRLERTNILKLSPQTINVAADGYWVFLKPLKQGRHEIYFHGSCSGGTRSSAAIYHINVS